MRLRTPATRDQGGRDGQGISAAPAAPPGPLELSGSYPRVRGQTPGLPRRASVPAGTGAAVVLERPADRLTAARELAAGVSSTDASRDVPPDAGEGGVPVRCQGSRSSPPRTGTRTCQGGRLAVWWPGAPGPSSRADRTSSSRTKFGRAGSGAVYGAGGTRRRGA